MIVFACNERSLFANQEDTIWDLFFIDVTNQIGNGSEAIYIISENSKKLEEACYVAKDIVDQFVEVSKVSLASIMKTEEPSIVEYGYVYDKPVSPNLPKNVVIGAALGMFLAAAIILVIYMLDDTVKSADDIEKYLGLNTLTAIPLKEDEEMKKRKWSKLGKGKKKDGK